MKLLQLLARNRDRAARARSEAPATVVRAAGASEATVYLYGAIVATQAEADWWGGVAADTLSRELRGLNVDTIHLRINSPGGDVFGAQAVAAALRDSAARVVAHIDALAASAATVIACAADEVVIAPGAMFMIHRAWTLAYGNTNDLADAAALLAKIDGTLAEGYATRTGGDVAAMLAAMDAETWYTAQEAVGAGFADTIAGAAPKAEAQWDLSAYAKAPTAQADDLAPFNAATLRAAKDALASAAAAAESAASAATNEHRARQRQRLRALTVAHPND